MQCDICGKETRVFLTEMEGAKIYVCGLCNPSGDGKVARQQRTEFSSDFVRKTYVPKFAMRKQEPFDLNNYDLTENSSEQIRKLRESKNLNVEDFARTLYVTASYLLKVEQGKLKPSAALLLKLYEKYNLLLVNKIPGKEPEPKKDFPQRPTIERNLPERRFENKRFEPRKFEGQKKEEKFLGSKEIYAPEEQKCEGIETVNHNNKKKLIL
ncbi:MAG: hypothetical protein COT14_03905 [Candidatus Diapherotrites archaeon CG08_land_8_20_14_0_20_30_16]|nr:MAG: hypothetical protein COT14_03905 [Candidatus Diapherotrites archaeon CG08_land_8_20_14_0_20_30_16]